MEVDLVEEEVAAAPTPYNGSSALWAHGSPPIVRVEDGVLFATVPEVSATAKPLCNTRMTLHRRAQGGWEPVYASPDYDQREPCPVAALPGGRVFVSVNPKLAPFGAEGASTLLWYCEPVLLEFDANEPGRFPRLVKPVWDEPWPFTDHSYRGLAADRGREELLLLNQEGNLRTTPYEGRYHWALLDRAGRTTAAGTYGFPVRACYPAVTLRDRAAHVLAVSDVEEPNAEWARFKREVTGAQWDFDFRRLWLASSPDLGRATFGEPLLLEDLDATAGYVRHLDLLQDDAGDLHVLYLRRNVWKTFVRDKFFPGLPLELALVYVKVSGGQVARRETLMACREDEAAPLVDPASFLGPWFAREQLRTNDPLPTGGCLHLGVDGKVSALVSVRPVGGGTGYRAAFPLDGAPTWGNVAALAPLDLFLPVPERNGSVPRRDRVEVLGAREDNPEQLRFASWRLP